MHLGKYLYRFTLTFCTTLSFWIKLVQKKETNHKKLFFSGMTEVSGVGDSEVESSTREHNSSLNDGSSSAHDVDGDRSAIVSLATMITR